MSYISIKKVSMIIIAMVIASATSFSHAETESVKIKEVEATFADYIPLLNTTGYQAYVFDISSLADRKYQITFQIREYDHGEKVSDDVQGWPAEFTNMILLSDFPEQARENVKPENIADPERGVYVLSNKINIGFLPNETDSIQRLSLGLNEIGTRYNSLVLKPQYSLNDPVNGNKFYTYQNRSFLIEEIKMDEFIPLVLVGSIWYDESIQTHRFCGERYIAPDLSSNILKFIPHYYIVGIVVTPVQS